MSTRSGCSGDRSGLVPKRFATKGHEPDLGTEAMSDEKPVTRLSVVTLKDYNDDDEAGVFEILEGYEPGDQVAVMLWQEYADLLAEVERLRAELAAEKRRADKWELMWVQAHARAERLEAALRELSQGKASVMGSGQVAWGIHVPDDVREWARGILTIPQGDGHE